MLLLLEAIELMLGNQDQNQDQNNISVDKSQDFNINHDPPIVRATDDDNNTINFTGASSTCSAGASRRTSATKSSKERIDEIFQKLDRVSCIT